jgi:outer membrane protein assembly factor BamE
MSPSVSSRPSRVATAVSPLRPLRALAGLAVVAVLAAGCTTYEESPGVRRAVAFVSPYHSDIIQGNVVTSEQMAHLKVGMTRAQVRDTLGSPLIADPFHSDRWDYVFTMQRQGIAPVQRAFVVRFQNDTVSQIDAAELPSETEFVKDISVRPLPTSTPQLELTPEEKAKLPVPDRSAAVLPTPAASATGAQRTYPPLEAS